MDRRTFLYGLTLGTLSAPLAAEAQQPVKVYRIGLLSESSSMPAASLPRALRELGWIEGQNLLIESRYAEGDIARLPGLAHDLIGLKVDVIVAILNHAIAAAKHATTSIPIVMMMAGDPVDSGFVTSLARPDGNVTSTTIHTPEVAGKVLEILKEALPGARRVGIIYDPGWPSMPVYMGRANAAAQILGLRMQYLEVRSPADIDAALARVRRERLDALYVASTGIVSAQRKRIFTFAMKSELPTVTPGSAPLAKEGCLIAYGYSRGELNRRTAALVDKILKGARPADLPVEQPTKFELVINLKTAKALGLSIPPSLLQRADEVIQ